MRYLSGLVLKLGDDRECFPVCFHAKRNIKIEFCQTNCSDHGNKNCENKEIIVEVSCCFSSSGACRDPILYTTFSGSINASIGEKFSHVASFLSCDANKQEKLLQL